MKLSADFIQFIQENPKLITMKESTRYPGLYVLKYTRKCFYDGIWNEYLTKARGMIIDAEYNIVVYGFDKIFNHFENNTNIDRDVTVTAIKKINGFMACATYVEGYGVIVSTTGSLDSDFVTLAEKYITPENKGVIERYAPFMTFMFEICDNTDPHIIPEKEGAYLLGARKIGSTVDYTSDMAWEGWLDEAATSMSDVKRPSWKVCRFSDIVVEANACNHEGFLVYSKDTALKIKSPYYKIKKFMARKNPEKLLKLLDKPHVIKQTVEEEFFPLIDFLSANKDVYSALTEQERLRYIEEFLQETT